MAANCWSRRFGEIGAEVPSSWAKSETLNSSSIQRNYYHLRFCFRRVSGLRPHFL